MQSRTKESSSSETDAHSERLSKVNSHERDACIEFFEDGHKYKIQLSATDDGTAKYTSVTTWIHTHFEKFDSDAIISKMMNGKRWNPENKYWGMTREQIKAMWNKNGNASSGAGTEMHYQIECFMNMDVPENEQPTHGELLDYYTHCVNARTRIKTNMIQPILKNKSEEWSFFLEFVKDNAQLKPYRTEWLIFDEQVRLAGSIDMVYQNDDGTLSIYDWKRCKNITPEHDYNKVSTNLLLNHIPDTNFWHYTLQLNTYKKILERNYNVLIRDLFLVQLHPDNPEKTYELIELPILSREMELLFEQRCEEL